MAGVSETRGTVATAAVPPYLGPRAAAASVTARPARGEARLDTAEIPSASVARLASYLHVLRALGREGAMIVSSSQLATAASVNPAILRKDLSYIGANGVRGVGYDVARLTARISLALHATGEFRVALAGAGVLARMLMAHTGPGRGFEVVAMFDSDPAEIGRRYSMRRQTYAEARADESIGSGADHTVPDEVVVEPMDDIARVCDVAGVDIAVIATADDTAQAACDAFAGAGVRQMLNMTSVPVRVPDHVVVRPVDIGLELQVLAFDASRATNPSVDAGADECAASAGTSGVGAALR